MEPVGYADQQRLEAQQETGAKRRVRRTAVARFPYALFPSCRSSRCSTAGALAEAWNIRGNDPYTLDPYTPSHPRSGCTGHVVSLGYSCFWLYSPFADRGNAVRVLLQLHGEVRAATRTGPHTERQRRRAQPGHCTVTLCCRRRIRHGAQRSSHTATPSRQAVDNPVVTALHRQVDALVALLCIVVAPCWSGCVSASCQHMSHRVRGGLPTLPRRCTFRPGSHSPAAPAPTDERLRESSTSAARPLPRGRIRKRDPSWIRATALVPFSIASSSVAESSGASTRSTFLERRPSIGSRREPDDVAPGTGVLTLSLPAGAYTPSRLSLCSPCGPHDESVTPSVTLAQQPCTDI